MRTVITFGTFDLFHIGHLRILQNAKSMGDRLVVGVSSDQFNFSKKSRFPIISEKDRVKIVEAIGCVDEVFLEESMDKKQEYIDKHGADILVMGDDWSGSFVMEGCETLYLPRTKEVSTTDIIHQIRERGHTRRTSST